MLAQWVPSPNPYLRPRHVTNISRSAYLAIARQTPEVTRTKCKVLCVLGIRSPGVENASKGLEPKPSG